VGRPTYTVPVAAQPLRPVYLVTGSDLPKIALALRRLRARFAEGSVERLVAGENRGSDVVVALNALGLFGGGERLVVVEEIECWKQADVDEIVRYLESPTPGAVLALVGDAAKLGPLAEACALAGDILRYDVKKKRVRGREVDDHPTWVQAQFERMGVTLDHEAAQRLVELVGTDTLALQSEVEKIAAWAGDGHVGVAEIEAVAVPSAETAGAALTNAWSARNAPSALAACEVQLRGEPEPFWLAGRLAAHVARVRGVQRLVGEGVPIKEIGKRLGLRFPPRREAAAAASYSADELDSAIARLAVLDHSIKGGSRLDPVLELERALIEISAPPEPHRE
jgi:DNA polymerase-3 subunit delta